MSISINQQSVDFSTSPQINLEDVRDIAELGYKTIINCRPDGEGGDGQPSADSLRQIAEAAGLAYYYIPVVPNNIQAVQVDEFKLSYAVAAKPVLAFCKTGNRAMRMFELSHQ
jgi:sulfide:quinone oxidoreductase